MPTIDTDASPATSITSLPSPMSDDEFSNLSDSWMEVETSSLGPSTFDGLSDSSFDSNDHDSRSEASSFDSASNDGREIHSEPEDVEPMSEEEAGETPSLISGSYDLASSKLDNNKMGSSVDTIQQYSTSSSQVRLIFPDPGSTFSPATAGSNSGIVSEQNPSSFFSAKRSRSRGQSAAELDERLQESILSNASAKRRSSSPLKNESWERSSKLWSLDKGNYWLLDSTERLEEGEGKMKELKAILGEPEGLSTVDATETKKDIVPEPKIRSKRKAILAVFAMLALGFAGIYTGYNMSSIEAAASSGTGDHVPVDTTRLKLWDRLSTSILAPAASELPHFPASTAPVKITGEYRMIKQGLFTFNEAQHKAHSVFHSTPPPSTQSKSPGGQAESLAVRDDKVALITLARDIVPSSIVRAREWRQKLNLSASLPDGSTLASAAAICTCDLSTYYSTQILPRIMGSYTRTKTLVVSAYDMLMRFFFKEVEEVYDVGRQMVEASTAAGSLVISRATRGARILNTTLTPYLRLSTLLNPKAASNVPHEAFDTLSEYVESTMEGLVDMIGHETKEVQDKAEKSIRKAKKGLNRVIRETRLDKERKAGVEKSPGNAVIRKSYALADPRSACIKGQGCSMKVKDRQQRS
ncbi:hypothetical protein IAR50_000672 [Cryptococcus sp. DSM 104548]